MARLDIAGFGSVEMELNRLLDRSQVRRIVEAGAAAAAEDMISLTVKAGHVRTGQMLGSIGCGPYKESLGGGSMSVYPQGRDARGTPNAVKMYVTNFGRGGVRRKRKMGDKFITKAEDATEKKVLDAMEEEQRRILEGL